MDEHILKFPDSDACAILGYELEGATESFPLRGCQNFGSTCWGNSLEIALGALPMVQEWARRHVVSCDHAAEPCLLCDLANDFAALKQASPEPHRPQLMEHRRHIHHTFDEGQQCISEGFSFLIAKLGNLDTARLLNIAPGACLASLYTLPSWYIFGGKIESRTVCSICHRTVRKPEHFTSLSLAIPAGSQPSLQEAIRYHLMSQPATDYACERCHVKSSSTSYRIISSPRVLAIHLKRWTQQTGRAAPWFTKDRRFVEFPDFLKMPEFGGIAYKLRAVVVHPSEQCFAGHYFTFARGPDGNWFKFDDETVTKAEQEVVLRAQAYMLFFEDC